MLGVLILQPAATEVRAKGSCGVDNCERRTRAAKLPAFCNSNEYRQLKGGSLDPPAPPK